MHRYLKQKREERGFSQEEVAKKLDVTRQAISRWERGESSPSTDNLLKLSKLYETSVEELVSEDRSKELMIKNLGDYISYWPIAGTMVSVLGVIWHIYKRIPANLESVLYNLMPIAFHLFLSLIATFFFNKYTDQRVPWTKKTKGLTLYMIFATLPFIVLYIVLL